VIRLDSIYGAPRRAAPRRDPIFGHTCSRSAVGRVRPLPYQTAQPGACAPHHHRWTVFCWQIGTHRP